MDGISTRRVTVIVAADRNTDLLPETLASARDVADEVLVVAQRSNAAAQAFAAQAAATFVPYDGDDDGAAVKNLAIERATGDWLLVLHAGERLTTDDAAALREFVTTAAKPSQVYWLLVRAPNVAPTAATEQVAELRLFPRQAGLRYQGRVRETILPAACELGLEFSAVVPSLDCERLEREADRKAAEARRSIRLAEDVLRRQGPAPRTLNCLADAQQTLGEIDRAVQHYRHALAISERGSLEMLEAYYGVITCLDQVPDAADSQIELCVEALAIFPADAQLLCAMGSYLQTQGQTELAARAYQTAYQFGQIQPAVWHVAEVREIAAVCHGLALQLLGRQDEAVAAWQSALLDLPHSTRLRRQLLEYFVRVGDRDAALAHVSELGKARSRTSRGERIELLRSAVRGACLAAVGNWIAGRAYLKAAWAGGCRDAICLRWYTAALAQSGELEDAAAIAEEWRRVDPASSLARQALETLRNSGAAPALASPPADPSPAANKGGTPPPVRERLRIDAGGHATEPAHVAPRTAVPRRTV